MYFKAIFVLVIYTSAASANIFQRHECSPSDFNCFDGTCLSLSKYCDGVRDCADGSDEATCDTGTSPEHPVLRRSTKQVQCRDGEWSCRDGSCISRRGKCDGEVHCQDGSDETSATCGRNTCDESEFRCAYGACVSGAAPCNGVSDCADNSDELLAHCFNQNAAYDTLWEEPESLNRIKRQANPACRKNQWRCADGSCISIYGKCDGIKDCPDGSDETFALCRKTPLKIYKKTSSNLYKSLEQKLWKEQAANLTKPKTPIRCQSNWFRCTYGACVDGTAPCNNVQECADNSDELLRRCRNQTEEVRGTFKCDDGQEIDAFAHCDGAKDCADGSDETVKACAGKTCASYLFQCAYGACVDQGSDCNNKVDCADGSDEYDDLCNRTSTAVVTPGGTPLSGGGACKLPPYPKHGAYVVSVQTQDSLGLNITCDPGYGLVGPKERVCFYGTWTPTVVTDCVRYCRLNKDPSVHYRCLFTGNAEGSRECEEYEPDGTIIRPKCNSPNYQYSGVLSYMRCIDGSWDYVARCNAGLAKHGTNITILIKDKVEIHISDFQYTVRDPNGNDTIKNVTSNNDQSSKDKVKIDSTKSPSDYEYDIDEGDWRIGPIRKTDKLFAEVTTKNSFERNVTIKPNTKPNTILVPVGNRYRTTARPTVNSKGESVIGTKGSNIHPLFNLNISNSSVLITSTDTKTYLTDEN